MKSSIKRILILSIAANVVLGLWFLIQRDKLLRKRNEEAIMAAGPKHVSSTATKLEAGSEQSHRAVREQNDGMVAATDQREASLEEHTH